MSRSSSFHTSLVAVLVFQVLALFVRDYLRLDLQQQGLNPYFARDLSYLVVPPILAMFMLPIIRANMHLLRDALDLKRVNLRLVVTAIGIGVLARLVWWLQLFARLLAGQARDSAAGDIAGPVFSFSCPPPQVMLVALLVFGCLIPIIEEVINRGLIQSWLMPRGKWFAIVASAALFAIFHVPASIPFAFIAGVVFGIQYSKTRSLWAPVITHASYDLLIILDWRCLNGVW
jgi:membrane protease YdiL (CAAX protease family)